VLSRKNDDSELLRIALLLIAFGGTADPSARAEALGRDDNLGKVRRASPETSANLPQSYRYFSACARSSGVICRQMRSRFCCAQSL
jgi:hypothetical protein